MAPPWRILTVCTANMCRSPMAEVLLRTKLTAAGSAASVSSCGLLSGGRAAAPEVIDAMADLGLDLGAHVSRQLAADLVAEADLVLAMAREHLREVVVSAPASFGRTFTIRELVRRGEATGPRPDGVPLAQWLEDVGRGRRPQDLLGGSDADDVADPIGGPSKGYAATARQLDDLCGRLVQLLRPDRA